MTTLREALAGTRFLEAEARRWLATPRSAWYVDAVVGAGLWVGAALLVVFLAFWGLFSEPALCTGLGLAFLVGAAIAARTRPDSAAISQLSFVSVVVGSSLVLAGTSLRRLRSEDIGLALVVLGVGVLFAVPGRATRFAATLAAGLGAGLVAEEVGRGALEVLVAIWCVVTTALWLWRPRLLGTAATQLVRVVSFASPAIAIGTAAVLAGMSRVSPPAPTFVIAITVAVCGVLTASRAWRDLQTPRAALVVAAIGAVVVAIAGRHAPLALVGVLCCGLAVVRRDRVLQGLGVVALIAGVGWMLWVAGSLSAGALTCLALGVGILVARFALLVVLDDARSGAGVPADASIRSPVGSRPQWLTRQAVALLASVLVSVGVVGGLMQQREALLARGTVVLLELAPTDPRSILQGDYMTLRYDASARISRDGPSSDVAVFVVDSDGVGHFSRLDDGRDLPPGEVRVRFRRRDGLVVFGSQTFLFEEGQGGHFARARYAEIRVDDGGTFLLADLRDETRASLGGARR